MTIKRHIAELNTLRKNGSKEYRENSDNVLDLYKERKVPNFRTAKTVVVNLAFPAGYTRRRTLKQNYNMIDKYNEATPLIGRIAREIQQKNDIMNNPELCINDL